MTPDRSKRKKAPHAKRPSASQQKGTSAGRDVPSVGLNVRGWWRLLGATALTLGMLAIIFAPIDAWPFAYVCFVPWLVVVGAAESPRRVYLVSYLLGLLFFCITISWLFIVTAVGAIVLFAMFAVYFPLVACPVRHMVRRRGWPLAFTFPVIWVGFEAVRSFGVLEFPWNLLGHSHHSVLTMIQISDLVGAYGVSFVLAAVNGAVADVLLCRWGWPAPLPAGRPLASAKLGVIFAVCLLVATVAYGQFQLHRTTMRDGPRIAILQGNYPNYVDQKMGARQPTPVERAERYFALMDEAAAYDPDLFLLPETAWFMYLNQESLEREPDRWYLQFSRECAAMFQRIATAEQAYVVTGSASLELTPFDLRASERRYNSAFVFRPEGGPPGRYDKNHLVMIGEYAPFRYGSLRFVYLWLNSVVPFGGDDYEYSLTAGTELNTFEMRAASLGGEVFGFATPICYENVMPYVSRAFVTDSEGRKRCDFLLNLSNDGWFLHSAELPQHLAASVFRAIENRVGVARAVNTGISCFVDPDGRVHDVVEKDGVVLGPDVDGYRVANVRVDSRQSLYSRWGDVFAVLCAVLWGVFYLDYIVIRWRSRRRGEEATQ